MLLIKFVHLLLDFLQLFGFLDLFADFELLDRWNDELAGRFRFGSLTSLADVLAF